MIIKLNYKILMILLIISNVVNILILAHLIIESKSQQIIITQEIPQPIPPIYLDIMLKKYSKKYNIPYRILRNIAELETGFKGAYHPKNNFYNPFQTSTADANGPLQVQNIAAYHVYPELKKLDPDSLKIKLKYDIEFNVDVGAHYLRILLDRFNQDYEKALTFYNTGYPTPTNNYAKYILTKGE